MGKSHLLSPQLVLVTHGWRRRGGGSERKAAGRKSSVDKKKLARGEKIEAIKSNFPSLFLNRLSFLVPLVLVSSPPCVASLFPFCLLQWLLPSP